MIRVEFYGGKTGPVSGFFDGLDDIKVGSILAKIAFIEGHGILSEQVDTRQIEGELWEIRIKGVRLLYVVMPNEDILIVDGYKKQSQKLPLHVKKRAIARINEGRKQWRKKQN